MIEDIRSRFPHLLPAKCECSIPEGWQGILQTLCEKLDALGAVELTQVKTKFGLLRVYYSAPEDLHDMATDLITEAECASAETCEVCGATLGSKYIHTMGAYRRCNNHPDL